MRIKGILVILGLALAALSGCGNAPSSSTSSQVSNSGVSEVSTATSTSAAPSIPKASHVFLIIEENQSFSTVYNNQMPYLSSLSTKYAYAANYSSTDGGSMLDYLVLSSGSNESSYGCQGWGCPNQMTNPIASDNVFRELTKAGLTWKVYAESLPQAGALGDGPYPYANRHNPAVWYSDIVNSKTVAQNVVPFTQLATDMANNALPNYILIIPNLLHDAHDGSPKDADDWLVANIKPILSQPMFGASGNALMFITFDECGGGTNDGCGGHVLTTVIGPKVRGGFVSQTAYSHPDTLRTILDALGVKVYPGASATAKSMIDFF